jgi:Domain of unknown function (DUF4173)
MNRPLPPPEAPPSPDAPPVPESAPLRAPGPDLPDPSAERSRRFVRVVLATGFVVNVAIRSSRPSLAWCLGGAAVIAAAWLAVRRTGSGRWLFVAALACVVPVTLRSSAWLVSVDLAVAAVLTLIGVVARAGGRPWLTLGGLLRGIGHSVDHVFVGGGRVGRMVRLAMPSGLGRRLRLIGVAAPIVLVVAALLLSADALFASFIYVPFNVGSLFSHTVVTMLASLVLAFLGAMGDWSGEMPDRPARRSVRAAEMVATLWGVAFVLGAYAVTQLVAAIAGRQYVERRVGLTYKAYARGGFFQLLAVAAIVLVLMAIARRLRGNGDVAKRRSLLILGWAVGALVLVVVAVSVARIQLYNDELGFTMLRLYSMTFAVWLGLVVVVAMMALARPKATWVLSTVGATAIVGLLGMNVVNPEVIVVRHNLTQLPPDQRDLHREYMLKLSDDSVPDMLRLAKESGRVDLVVELCNRPRPATSPRSWNLASARADDALRRYCDGFTRG